MPAGKPQIFWKIQAICCVKRGARPLLAPALGRMTPVGERPAGDAPEPGADDIAVSRIDASNEALLGYLRGHLRLHGTKKGCDQGACAPARCSLTTGEPCRASPGDPVRRPAARCPSLPVRVLLIPNGTGLLPSATGSRSAVGDQSQPIPFGILILICAQGLSGWRFPGDFVRGPGRVGEVGLRFEARVLDVQVGLSAACDRTGSPVRASAARWPQRRSGRTGRSRPGCNRGARRRTPQRDSARQLSRGPC